MSEKRIWAMGSPNKDPYDQLNASMMSLHTRIVDDYVKSFTDDYERSKPFRWNQIREETLAVEDYRGETITKKKFTYAPPEKEGAFGFFYGGKPDGLRDDNTTRRFETRNWSGKYKRYHMTAAKARAYIDENLAIDAHAEALKPLVNFLEHDMPCTCGEHGVLTDREYLEKAYEALMIARKIT